MIMPLDRASLATTKQNRDVYRDGLYIKTENKRKTDICSVAIKPSPVCL